VARRAFPLADERAIGEELRGGEAVLLGCMENSLGKEFATGLRNPLLRSSPAAVFSPPKRSGPMQHDENRQDKPGGGSGGSHGGGSHQPGGGSRQGSGGGSQQPGGGGSRPGGGGGGANRPGGGGDR